MIRRSEKTVAMRRASSRQWVLKPQDLAVALKLVALRGRWLPYAALGEAMRLSRFEAHAAVQRLLAARLLASVEGQPTPVLAALREFVVHGAPYAYPPVRGEITIGFPTAHGAAPLKEMITPANDAPPVWPHPEGTARGPGLLGLYENVPLAARDDAALYELLALFDALRAGRAGDRKLAAAELNGRLGGAPAPPDAAPASDADSLVIGEDLVVARSALQELVRRYHIRRLAVFGSAARGELRPDSDVDLLVEFVPGQAPSLWSARSLQSDFSRLFGGRPVDIAAPEILRNPYRRQSIEKDLKVLYEAA